MTTPASDMSHSSLISDFIHALEESGGDPVNFLNRWQEIQAQYAGKFCGCGGDYDSLLTVLSAGVDLMLREGWTPGIFSGRIQAPFGGSMTVSGLAVVNGDPNLAPLHELQTVVLTYRISEGGDIPGSKYVM